MAKKNPGWKKEHYRHSLARHGITTAARRSPVGIEHTAFENLKKREKLQRLLNQKYREWIKASKANSEKRLQSLDDLKGNLAGFYREKERRENVIWLEAIDNPTDETINRVQNGVMGPNEFNRAKEEFSIDTEEAMEQWKKMSDDEDWNRKVQKALIESEE